MSDFETVTCEQCRGDFKAYPDFNAAERGFCSPACALETN
ncbi:hypothetical protein C488_09549 [Natrinema pellirubrum DSM 15624]|uniref:Small CPxCG-related zinc finger protein n=1 Tax=Natrinema pellirubrum (strain DSM 15624 / CIP 106293 / JCM 10476 / NCIMB 786 / 157) TaxID=797303 RepID=L0JMZ8_NATP1|nr:hypothetical protein Natpe_3092 [Natrinema pellirubrum DSM 15624]ELY75645.1 hypothetical protein C488_09549 [Natrinema pellirubrum DSM 15624]